MAVVTGRTRHDYTRPVSEGCEPHDRVHINIWAPPSAVSPWVPCRYETLPAGQTLAVFARHVRGGNPSRPQFIPTEFVLRTAGSLAARQRLLDLAATVGATPMQLQQQARQQQHCVHFQGRRMCILGSDCNFIHSKVPPEAPIAATGGDYAPAAVEPPPPPPHTEWPHAAYAPSGYAAPPPPQPSYQYHHHHHGPPPAQGPGTAPYVYSPHFATSEPHYAYPHYAHHHHQMHPHFHHHHYGQHFHGAYYAAPGYGYYATAAGAPPTAATDAAPEAPADLHVPTAARLRGYTGYVDPLTTT